MKAISLPLLLTLFIFSGCSSILPGHDPLVVRSEQTVQASVDIIDALLKLEYTNREALKRVSPDIFKFAEKLRYEAPKWVGTANSTIRTYKKNRTPENKATLITAVAVLQNAVIEAQKYLSTPIPH